MCQSFQEIHGRCVRTFRMETPGGCVRAFRGDILEDVSDLRSWKISVGCVGAYWRMCRGLQEEDLCRMCQNFQEGDPFEDVSGLTGGRSLEDVSEFP